MERLLRRAARRGDQDGHNGMINRRSEDPLVSTSAVSDVLLYEVNEGRVPVSDPDCLRPCGSYAVERCQRSRVPRGCKRLTARIALCAAASRSMACCDDSERSRRSRVAKSVTACREFARWSIVSLNSSFIVRLSGGAVA